MGKAEKEAKSKTALLSDIHGNSPALRSVLDDIQREQCSRVFVLGDIFPGVDPHGCVQMLRTWGDENGVDLTCIKGNAEAYLLTPDRDLLVDQVSAYRAGVLKLMQWHEEHLSESDLGWIYSMPETIRWKDAYLVHDSPKDRLAVHSMTDVLPQYRELNYHGHGITPDMSESDWEGLVQYMRSEGMTDIFSGHTHRPFYRESGGLLVCNVGSVGMPLDGDPRPSWVMLTGDGSASQSVSVRRVNYDIPSMLELIDRAHDYPGFDVTGVQEAYKKMYLHGRYWGDFMPRDDR